jgi:hypothetical protein
MIDHATTLMITDAITINNHAITAVDLATTLIDHAITTNDWSRNEDPNFKIKMFCYNINC